MTASSTALVKVSPQVIESLDAIASESAHAMNVAGRFEKAFAIAGAIERLKAALTPEVMRPISALAGNRLGFKTDKETRGGYAPEIIRDCLIEAILQGVYPVGNEFNIIAGNCYITKEGMEHKLRDLGLRYTVTPGIPRVSQSGDGAIIKMHLEWEFDGPKSKEIEFCIRVNGGMGTDAIIGKAYRKSYAWLYKTITGQGIPDGEADDTIDIEAKVVQAETPASGKSPIASAMKGRKTSAEPQGDPLQAAIDALHLPVAISAQEVRDENAKATAPLDESNLLANAASIANRIANRRA